MTNTDGQCKEFLSRILEHILHTQNVDDLSLSNKGDSQSNYPPENVVAKLFLFSLQQLI